MPTISLIEKKTASNVSSVTFSSIPSTFRDLRLIINYATDVTGNYNGTVRMQINTDTGSNYNAQLWAQENATMPTQGTNTGVTSLTLGSGGPSTSNNSSNRNPIDVYFNEYANTNVRKNGLTNNWGGGVSDSGSPTSGNPYNYVYVAAWEWVNTSAVSSITVLTSSNNFTNATFHLYGIG